MKEFLNLAAKNLLPIVTMLAMNVLKGVLNVAWESFWLTIFEAIQEAEKNISGSLIKKDEVIKKVMEFIAKYKKLSLVQTWAVKLFIGKVVDAAIEELNNDHGKKWVDTVKDIEQKINQKINIIDPL